MTGPVLVIADLHLDPSRPGATRTFLRFLQTEAPQAEAVYILGDLFEAWIGDDAVTSDEPSLQALRSASATTDLYVMPGNRDFLLGEGFAESTGAILLPDPSVVTIHGERTLLMHGDSLCTADAAYMAFRAKVRDPAWQAQFLSLPIAERLEQARQARSASRERGQQVNDTLLDVTAEAVADAVQQHSVRWLIHGHTHRPGIHALATKDGPGKRFVVGDWFDQGSVLRCLPGTWTLETLPHER
ncbi:MAG: UDP-2,3-diacylglucosamine diphosphatase [Halorhodospira sp.]